MEEAPSSSETEDDLSRRKLLGLVNPALKGTARLDELLTALTRVAAKKGGQLRYVVVALLTLCLVAIVSQKGRIADINFIREGVNQNVLDPKISLHPEAELSAEDKDSFAIDRESHWDTERSLQQFETFGHLGFLQTYLSRVHDSDLAALKRSYREDPDNGIYDLLALPKDSDLLETKQVTEPGRLGAWSRTKNPAPTHYKVTDEKKFVPVLPVIKRSLGASRLNLHHQSLAQISGQRIARGIKGKGYAARLSATPLIGYNLGTSLFALPKTSEYLSAAGYVAMLRGDRQQFIEVEKIAYQYLSFLRDLDDNYALSHLVANLTHRNLLTNLSFQADKLGLIENANRLYKLRQAVLDDRSVADKQLTLKQREMDLFRRHSSTFTSSLESLAKYSPRTPLPTREDLAPLLHAEKLFYSKVALFLLSLICLVVAGAVFGWLRFSPKAIHLTGRALTSQLRHRDWFLILSLGLLLPLSAVLLIITFTELTGRTLSLPITMMPNVIQATAAVVSIFCITSILTRWRVALALPALKIQRFKVRSLIPLFFCSLGFVISCAPLLEWKSLWEDTPLLANYVGLEAIPFLLLALLYFLVPSLGRNRFEFTLVRQVAGHAVILNTLGLAIISVGVLVPLAEKNELIWASKDTLYSRIADGQFSTYETQAAKDARERFQRIFVDQK